MDEAVGALRGITVDVSDLDRSETFWSAILGLDAHRRHEQYLWFDEVAPGVRLILQQVSDRKVAKNRAHLDLGASDPEALAARVVALGGHEVERVDEDDYSLTVLADPDGNEFCVLRRLSAGLTDVGWMPSLEKERR